MSFQTIVILLSCIVGTVVIVSVVGYMYYVRVWFRALTVGSPVTFMRLFGLTARRLSAYRLVFALARARDEGISVTLEELESEYAAGVDPRRIAHLLIEAKRHGRTMTVQGASERVRQEDGAAAPAVNQEGKHDHA